jgi:hypothetical protein
VPSSSSPQGWLPARGSGATTAGCGWCCAASAPATWLSATTLPGSQTPLATSDALFAYEPALEPVGSAAFGALAVIAAAGLTSRRGRRELLAMPRRGAVG